MTAMLPGPGILFCPADRPDRYVKAAEMADAVILDLEDAVADTRKAQAREALCRSDLDPARTIVRINRLTTDDGARDLAALRTTSYRLLMLPKMEQPSDAESVADYAVVALCETAAGIVNAAPIAAAPNVIAVMWGAEDLIASLGGMSSRLPGGGYRDVARHARSTVLLAAAAAGKDAVDAVFLDTDDLDGLSAESADAVASGFAAKACIHPRQVEPVRRAFTPSVERVRWAQRIIASAGTGGVLIVDGQMVDAPLLRQAERTLAAAGVHDGSL